MKICWRIVFLLLIFVCSLTPAHAIKIGLLTNASRAYIGASTPAEVIDVRTNKLLFSMTKMQGYEFRVDGNSILVKIAGEWKRLPTDSIVVKPEIDGFVSVILCLRGWWG